MTSRQFILAQLIFLAAWQNFCDQKVATAQPVAQPYPTFPPMVVAPPGAMQGVPYSQPAPMFQSAPQNVSVYPSQPALAPPPIGPPGPTFAPGGAVSPQFGLPTGPEVLPLPAGAAAPQLAPNPIAVPVADNELAWDQIADVVSEYFTIAREQRAVRDGQVWTEGRIETAPQDGATWLEPHRHDSVGTFNRWESTFQTIRRRAVVRVIPDAAGYLVEVIVEKELEDLPSPEKATAGAATFRNDGSLPSRRLEQVSRTSSSPRWIQLGRDPALEQKMLADIQSRFGAIAAGPQPVFAR